MADKVMLTKEDDRKPIWKIAEELSRTISAQELATMPTNGAAQHDHYIHCAPRRSTS